MKYKCLLVLMLFGIGKAISQEKVEYSFAVEGACGMCEDRIEEVAVKNGGAESADWDGISGILTIEIDETKTSITKVRREIALAGHDNGNFIAPEGVYNNLPACCQYREVEKHGFEVQTETPSIEDPIDENIHIIEGKVFELKSNGARIPLIGATVVLADTGTGTTTNFDGYFKLPNPNHESKISISFIGFETQTIRIDTEGVLEITLADGVQMETVEIKYKKKTTEVSFVNTLNVQTITREELCKAACCNLSESFETNPSVDVSFNDAVTGTKQIQMLGLAGPYVQITRELLPDIRVMNSVMGLSMTPGPFIESIQLIKGAGSVVNGFESIAGQINVEYKKPERGEKLHINGFVNNGGRVELNSNVRHDIGEHVSTSVLVHGKRLQSVHDRNKDGFTDMPMENDYVFANRWKFKRKKEFEGQIGVKYSTFDHSGGSHDHFAGISEDHESHWQMYNDVKRAEIWGKTGFVSQENPQHSVGLQWSLVDHKQESQFGNTLYDSDQQSVYANLIYQNIFPNEHILRAGLAYQYDDVDEWISTAGVFNRSESVPGVYAEYNIKKDNKWTVIPGIRADKHSNYGWFITPRLHAKYNFSDRSIIRLMGGRGLRTASIFAENLGLFASSRLIEIDNVDNGNPYGLEAEVAWNYGINFTHGIDVAQREMVISLDAFRTNFENQIVVDYEDPRKVSFYNLEGDSYSNSFQVKLDYELLENLDVRVAYRLFDVKTSYSGELQEKPMVSKHRAFINAAYKTNSDWHFDATLNWRGSKRLPSTASNPTEFQRPDYSPDYVIMNAQIMKRWGKKWDVYIGGENLFNYRQEDAIISGDDAFGQYFDASLVWAPLFGANIYAGFRYNL